jgi:hypothetical protein
VQAGALLGPSDEPVGGPAEVRHGVTSGR